MFSGSGLIDIRQRMTFGVKEYRAFFVGRDGHFDGVEQLLCNNDDEAVEQVKRLANQYGVELWNGSRLVARIDPKAQ